MFRIKGGKEENEIKREKYLRNNSKVILYLI